MKKANINRRKFLGQASCLAVGSLTFYSSVLNLKTLNAIMGSTTVSGDDYKALVCILLAGGNDSYNMVVPQGVEEYAQYSSVRTNQALPREALLPLQPINPDGKDYGLHPAMPDLQQYFNDGQLAIISNVGTLVEPTTKGDLISQTAKLPLGLFFTFRSGHALANIPAPGTH